MTAPLYAEQIAEGIRARHLATPMDEVYCLAPDTAASVAMAELSARQFDYAPVRRDDHVIGLVAQAGLIGHTQVEDCVAPLHDGSVISADVGLPDLLAFLQVEPVLFVLEGRSISGLVTPADLGRPASRTYFYLLLAQLEIALADLVRLSYPDQDRALSHLTPDRRTKITKLAEHLRGGDELIDTVATLSLTDLIRIVGSDPAQRATYVADGWSWRRLTNDLGEFRDDVMHPVRDFRTATPVGMGKLLVRARALQWLTQVTTQLLTLELSSASVP